jgi:hypothetical protein
VCTQVKVKEKNNAIQDGTKKMRISEAGKMFKIEWAKMSEEAKDKYLPDMNKPVVQFGDLAPVDNDGEEDTYKLWNKQVNSAVKSVGRCMDKLYELGVLAGAVIGQPNATAKICLAEQAEVFETKVRGMQFLQEIKKATLSTDAEYKVGKPTMKMLSIKDQSQSASKYDIHSLRVTLKQKVMRSKYGIWPIPFKKIVSGAIIAENWPHEVDVPKSLDRLKKVDLQRLLSAKLRFRPVSAGADIRGKILKSIKKQVENLSKYEDEYVKGLGLDLQRTYADYVQKVDARIIRILQILPCCMVLHITYLLLFPRFSPSSLLFVRSRSSSAPVHHSPLRRPSTQNNV